MTLTAAGQALHIDGMEYQARGVHMIHEPLDGCLACRYSEQVGLDVRATELAR